MKLVTIILILIVLLSCNSKHGPYLTLAQLKFSDPEREAIVYNKVCAIIGYDTSNEFFPHQSVWSFKGDTIIYFASERYLYNLNGTLAFTYAKYQNDYGRSYSEFGYDSNGRVLFEHDYPSCFGQPVDSLKYFFFPEKSMLYTIKEAPEYNNGVVTIADHQTTSSFFDTSGRVTRDHIISNDSSQIYDCFYSYNSTGQLIYKMQIEECFGDRPADKFEKQKRTLLSKDSMVSSYYYSGVLLDSIIKYSYCPELPIRYFKRYYNRQGILSSSIYYEASYMNVDNKRELVEKKRSMVYRTFQCNSDVDWKKNYSIFSKIE